ncbi:hypothetical protein BKI52_20645 [marine bacterium AO1-C]|nr:hypothetical protein BKI52_20645 [marine bacterium AO1-C]
MRIYKFFKLSFLGFTLAILTTGSIIYFQSLMLHKDVAQLVLAEEPMEKAVLAVEILSLKSADNIKSTLYLQNPHIVDTLKKNQAQLNSQIEQIDRLNKKYQIFDKSALLKSTFKAFDQSISNVILAYESNPEGFSKNQRSLLNQLDNSLKDLQSTINNHIQPIIQQKNQQILLQSHTSSMLINAMVLTSLIALMIAMYFNSRYFKRRIIQPLLTLNDYALTLARGMYSERWGNLNVPKGSHEIQQLFMSFNKMAAGIHILFKQEKKSNLRLQKLNQNFHKAQKIAQMGSWELDLKTQRVSWNDQMYDIYGIQKGRKINIDVLTPQVHPQDSQKVSDLVNKLIEDAIPYSIDYRINHPKNGGWHHLHSESEIIYDERQQPVKAIGITQDVTHLKKAQNLLESYRKILDQSAIVATTDVKGNITYANDKFCEISQYSQQELLGQNHRILKSGYHPDEIYKELWHTVAQGKTWQGELQNKSKDGSFYWVKATIMPFMDEKNKPYKYMAVRYNITHQKNLELDLKKQVMQLNDYKFALDTAAIVATTNVKGHITYVNDRFCEISKYSREELLGQDHRLINSGHHSKTYIRKMWQTIAKGLVWRDEFKNQAKDGSYYWVDTTIVPFLNDEGKPYMYLTIRFDITHRKELEDALRAHQAVLETKVKQRTQQLEDERNRVSEMYEELIVQNELIGEKNKNITDSIEYALKIQEATLPQIEKIKAQLPELFILFKPRDIVSGDFYWYSEVAQPLNLDSYASKVSKKLVLAAVDCTGHGVPGAFMSMIGNQLLNEIVNEKNIIEPHFILNELNKKIRVALQQDELDNQDGMDIAICVIDKAQRKLEFAGAKNPLIYTQNGTLGELKGDRTSIGGIQRPGFMSYTKHTLSLKSDQTFYIFSDGYQDQMGGPKGRKLMRRGLYKLLAENQHLPLNQQYKVLEESFEDWKGQGYEQLDDVLLMGFRIKELF